MMAMVMVMTAVPMPTRHGTPPPLFRHSSANAIAAGACAPAAGSKLRQSGNGFRQACSGYWYQPTSSALGV